MKMKRLVLGSILILVAAACSRHEVTREQWLAGTPRDRELIVRSFLGGEQAAASKGGQAREYSREPVFYREQIDRRYAAGDGRPVNEIWSELSDRSLAAPSP